VSIAGDWTIEVTRTPIGELTATVNLRTNGHTLTGTVSAAGTTVEISGTADGDNFTAKGSITTPVALNASVTGTVSGDSMSGQISSTFGNFHFAGTRG
jgi:hypothetical protein